MRGLILIGMILPVLMAALPLDRVTDNGDLPDEFVHPDTHRQNASLGIVYRDVSTPSMIGYELPAGLVKAIKSGTAVVDVAEMSPGLEKVTLRTTKETPPVVWYFRDGLWVSPLSVKTGGWTIRESRFFRYTLENPGDFSARAVTELDRFTESFLRRFAVSTAKIEQLSMVKIPYYLCESSESVQSLTGYTTQGVFILADNAVVSALPCHYHEVAHLLMNYIIGEVPVFTHPFYQEGIATFSGGRDGKSAEVIITMGRFLLQSGFVTPDEVMNGETFQSMDASVSYPVAAACHSALLGDPKAYLEGYLAYSSKNPQIRLTRVTGIPLPDLIGEEPRPTIALVADYPADLTTGTGDVLMTLDEAGDRVFAVKSEWIGFRGHESELPSCPKLFTRLLPSHAYEGWEYLLHVRPDEVTLYDLLTGTIIGVYAAGLSAGGEPLVETAGFRLFRIRGDLLPEDVTPFTIP